MRKLLLAGALLGGLLLTPGAAQAAVVHGTVLEGDIPVSLNSSMQPVGGASGTYHIKVESITIGTEVAGQTSWRVTINGNPDGNATDNTNAVKKSGVKTVSFNFWKNFNGTGVISPVSVDNAQTNAYVATGAPAPYNTNVGGPSDDTYGDTGGAWTESISSSTLSFDGGPNVDRWIAPFGGNQFTTDFTVQATANEIRLLHVVLQDSGQQWTRDFEVVPEPATMLLAGAGLAPLAGLLKRRRRNSEVEETEETA